MDPWQGLLVVLLLLATVSFTSKGKFWGQKSDGHEDLKRVNGFKSLGGNTRDVVKHMKETGKDCVIFFGSQSGTAQDFATRLAKEGHSRFGLNTLLADLEDYDYESLAQFPPEKMALFILATYGEGEPTDNAVDFYEFINEESPAFAEDKNRPLETMRYAMFGLGNSTYEHFNAVARRVDKALQTLGAVPLCPSGEGNDGGPTPMEEDFLTWKEQMWASVASSMGLKEREVIYEPTFRVTEDHDLEPDKVFLGEIHGNSLSSNNPGPFGPHNPYIAPIVESKELFTTKDRNCLHLEIDISGTNLTYQTGDHLAVWPMNADSEVERFLKVFGLLEKRNKTIRIEAIDDMSKVPFPTPTTYEAAVRYYLEICAPVSRQFLSSLSQFIPDESMKKEMIRLGSDKEYFSQMVSSRCLNLAQTLEQMSTTQALSGVPFSVMVEGLKTLQPRYYSISSSSEVQKSKVSITAVVESVHVSTTSRFLKGVATNYLLALKQHQHGESNPDPHGLSYAIEGPRRRYANSVPVHIRQSNFKLPSDHLRPIIMIGPGTGVAPLRAFVQERAAQVQAGVEVGKSILFFGCRKKSEDFVYENEWKVSRSLPW